MMRLYERAATMKNYQVSKNDLEKIQLFHNLLHFHCQKDAVLHFEKLLLYWVIKYYHT